MIVLEPAGTLMKRLVVPASTPDPASARSNTFCWVLVPVRSSVDEDGVQSIVAPAEVVSAPQAALCDASVLFMAEKAGKGSLGEAGTKLSTGQLKCPHALKGR
jgi:hypothetical protein